MNHPTPTAQRLLEQILAAIRFELACPGTFDFKRAEQVIRDALQQKEPQP